jgi:hypothetical protein
MDSGLAPGGAPRNDDAEKARAASFAIATDTYMKGIFQAADLPDGAGRVVVYEWEAGSKRDENLVCLGDDGQVRWKAQLPTNELADCFVGVRIENDLVVANSFSCYAVWIDPATGLTLRTQFTK